MNEFSKIAGYKISIQKSVAFLYTSNEVSEIEIKVIISTRNKIPRNNLTREVKDLYLENRKTLMKEFENDTKKWRDLMCSWIVRINEYCNKN